MFHRILTTVDLTETSPQVVEEAIAIAAPLGAELMLLHVISPEDELYLPYSLYPAMDGYTHFSESAFKQYEQRIKAHKDKCRAKLEAFQIQACQQGVDTEIRLVTGETGHAICDVVKEWQGDLILLGNRGLRGLKEMMLGSVSSFVMHHSPCSVLVLRGFQPKQSDSSKTAADSKVLNPLR